MMSLFLKKMELTPIPETHTEEIDATIALTQISFTGSQKGGKCLTEAN